MVVLHHPPHRVWNAFQPTRKIPAVANWMKRTIFDSWVDRMIFDPRNLCSNKVRFGHAGSVTYVWNGRISASCPGPPRRARLQLPRTISHGSFRRFVEQRPRSLARATVVSPICAAETNTHQRAPPRVPRLHGRRQRVGRHRGGRKFRRTAGAASSTAGRHHERVISLDERPREPAERPHAPCAAAAATASCSRRSSTASSCTPAWSAGTGQAALGGGIHVDGCLVPSLCATPRSPPSSAVRPGASGEDGVHGRRRGLLHVQLQRLDGGQDGAHMLTARTGGPTAPCECLVVGVAVWFVLSPSVDVRM